MSTLAPTTEQELCEAIAAAAARRAQLEIRAGASQAEIGARRDAAILDVRGFRGVIDYDPPELTLTVKAGTPLSQVEQLISAEDQALAFEPWDPGPLFGRPAGDATIGGVMAAGVAGPGRVIRGSARDHLLGTTAVSGRAELFVAGGRVVKNVTGYDVPKLLAGSWGRLAVMTQLTLKVAPRPRVSATMALEGLATSEAVAAMSCAMGSQADVSAAAHLPTAPRAGRALTLLRLQGFERSVEARCGTLNRVLQQYGTVHRLGRAESADLWSAIRTAAALGATDPLWRLHVPPSRAAAVVAALEPLGVRWLFDWAGALIWIAARSLATDVETDAAAGAALIRLAAESAGGHAMLVRAPQALRDVVPALHPRSAAVSALERRVRRAFDPAGVFETGRFLD